MAEKDDYLVEILVDLGFVTADQVAELRTEASSAGVGVVDLMLANKLIRPADVAQAKAAHFGAEVVNLADLRLTDETISIIRRDIAKKYRVIPISRTANTIVVAVSDPSDLDTIDTLHHLLRADIELKVASDEDLESALNKYYGGRAGEDNSKMRDAIQELTESEVAVVKGDDLALVKRSKLMLPSSNWSTASSSKLSSCAHPTSIWNRWPRLFACATGLTASCSR